MNGVKRKFCRELGGVFESRLTLTGQNYTLTEALFFLVSKWFSPLMFPVVLDFYSSKLKGKQYNQIT